jgi:hypothetical protein
MRLQLVKQDVLKNLYNGIQNYQSLDSLYTFKCKGFRNTRHTVIFGLPF